MYSQIFWDEIYSSRGILPWASDTFSQITINHIKKHIESRELKDRILDYGCGTGRIGEHFLSKGFIVDFADISSMATASVRDRLGNLKCNIFTIGSPCNLKSCYDVIICWGVLHHINPIYWDDFMEGFRRILNRGGILIIGGWDKRDVEFKNTNHRISKVTNTQTWSINGLERYVDNGMFSLSYKEIFTFVEPHYNINRTFVYYVLT